MKIYFKTIPHDKQRYPTVGDYFPVLQKKGRGSGFREKVEHFRVSKMGNEEYEFLVFIHELIEWYLCRKRGIAEKDIDAFDIEFEKNRPEGNVDEPGDSPQAPYYNEHQFATRLEKLMAAELGVDWNNYNKTVENL